MTENTRIYERYEEYNNYDCDCERCLYRLKKSKYRRADCQRETCYCEEELRGTLSCERLTVASGVWE
jgi:hypothetical protein